MSLKIAAKTFGLAAFVAGAGIAFSPLASAQCTDTGGAIVCQEGRGSSSIYATVPDVADGGGFNQNGIYGPAGDRPPLGN